MELRVQIEDFDVAEEMERLRSGNTGIGAVVTFVGYVRDLNDGTEITELYLEHYPAMTTKALEEIVAEARRRWRIEACRVVHRVGRLLPSDQIVLVAVASAHRGDAFAACEFLMDYLKTRAPFWKKERTAKGERWVESRESDRVAAERWHD